MPTLTLRKLVQEEGGAFGPEDIAVMSTAFEDLLSYLKVSKRDDPKARIVAKLLIELVRNGERDPARLRNQVLRQYQAHA